MDLLVVDHGITHCISDLTGLDIGKFLDHTIFIFLGTLLRNEVDQCCNSLWDRLGRKNDDFLILTQRSRLICSQYDIFIVWQYKNGLGRYFSNRTQDILCARIHGLTAFDHVIYAQFLKDLIETFADRYGNKSHFLFLSLLCNRFLCILEQTLLMLLTHIVNLDLAKRTMCQGFLNGKSRIIGMYMGLNDLIICNNDDRITDGFEIALVLLLLCLSQWFI